MNKELVIHLTIGAAAVGTLYWLWTKNRSTAGPDTSADTAQILAGASQAQTDTSTWYGIIASGGDYGRIVLTNL